MKERRIQRLQEQIKARVAEIVMHELADPKIGLVTIARIELDKEFTVCKVFWSVLGDDKQRARTNGALQRARGFVQREVGYSLHTRTVPHLEFVFDESIAGVIRMQQVIGDLKKEREARTGPETPGPAPQPTTEPTTEPPPEPPAT